MHDFARESQKPTSDFSEMTGWLSEKIVHSVRSLPRRGAADAFPLPNRVADRGFEGSGSAQDDNQVAHLFLSQNGEPRNPHKKGFSSLRPTPPSPPASPPPVHEGRRKTYEGSARGMPTKRSSFASPQRAKQPSGLFVRARTV